MFITVRKALPRTTAETIARRMEASAETPEEKLGEALDVAELLSRPG
jgi:hypothetical protein